MNVLSTVLVILVVIVALSLVISRIAGLQILTVLSGSMEPTYHTGSLIVVRPTDPKTLKAGDVITYLTGEKTNVTHRIIEVVPDENDPSVLRFGTMGDANPVRDGVLVHERNVLGVPVLSIPLLGYFVNWIQNPPGLFIAIGVVAAVVFLSFVPTKKERLFEEKPGN
jgi:signal peptidase